MASTMSILSTTTLSPSTITASFICDSNITNSSMMISEEERLEYLHHLQADTTITMIPAMTFLTLLAVTGLVGNSLVIFVYSQRFSLTATKVLIMTIAAFDLVANTVVIPTNIYDMFHMWDFNNPNLCRLRKFTNSFTTVGSAMALVAVAVVRYRKVCNPHGWHVNIRHAKIISVVVAVMGALCSLPYTIINGHETKMTPRPPICGSACDIDDKFVKTRWPLIVNGFFLLICFGLWIPLIVIYIRIGIVAWRHSREYGTSDIAMTAMKTKDGRPVSYKMVVKSSTEMSSTSADMSGSNMISKLTESFECITEDDGCAAELKAEYALNRARMDGAEAFAAHTGDGRAGVRSSSGMDLTALIKDATANDFSWHNSPLSLGKDNSTENVNRCGDSRAANWEQDGTENDAPSQSYGDSVDKGDEGTFSENPDETSSPLYHNHAGEQDEPTVGDESRISTDRYLADDGNKIPGEADHITNLKWLDIMHTPQESLNSNTYPKAHAGNKQSPGKPSSVASSSKHNALQKAEGLRRMILEALAKEKFEASEQKMKKVKSDPNMLALRRSDEKHGIQTPAVTINDTQERKTLMQEESEPTQTEGKINKLKKFITKAVPGKKSASKGRSRRRRLGHTNIMLLIISAVFVIGFIPYLVVIFFTYAAPAKFAALTMVELSFYHLFLRFYILNSAANPVIYSLCNKNFRKECLKLVKWPKRRII